MNNHTFSTLPSSKAMLNKLTKAGTIPTRPTAVAVEFTDLEGFIPRLNKVSQSVHDEYFEKEELLVARDSETAKRPGQPTRTNCRPNITLAFQSYWWNKNDTPMSWTRVELVGEKASTGSTDPLLKTASYVHYWLLSRPDRMVALSFLTAQRGITFLVAPQGTTTTYTLFLPWRSPSITKMVFAFLYRLYDPGEWAMPRVSRRVDGNDTVFDVRTDDTTIYLGFKPIFASDPFRTRTHVFANPDHPTVRVIKSQLSRNSRRFLEREIYNHIHRDGDVPGIPHVHFFFDLPAPPDALRTQNIIGLREHGYPIMMAATLRDVLEILYDILEVMRFLYFTHHVLHRDISKGNILFLVESISPEPIPAGGKDIRFVQHLLSDSATPPHTTRAMLIDFNNSEILGAKQAHPEVKETIRTGTPGFVSRAVERNGPLPFAKSKPSDVPDIYADKNKDRIDSFIPSTSNALPQQSTKKPWRHDLEHDTESVFWVLFTTSWFSRDALLTHIPPNAFHSSYAPAVTLVEDMAEVIRHDRYWLPEQDPQNRPEVALDAFQRLILNFIIQQGTEKFMSMEVDARNPRVPGFGPRSVSLTGTPDLFESLSKEQDELGAKRKGESANDEDGSTSKKARRGTTHLDGDTAADAGEYDAAGNNTDAQGSDQAEAQNPPLQMWEKLQGTQKIVITVENGRYVPRLM
ncbi:hypothetical protein ONZ45_g3314 [Pleurotus djamor]|nr:hypothetical protein ONZ45_g3314 [Pleurotus djamor]